MAQMDEGRRDFEQDFALRQALQAGDPEEVQQAVAALNRLISEQGYFDRLWVFGAAGHLLCCTDDRLEVPEDVVSLVSALAGSSEPRRGVGLDTKGQPLAFLVFPITIRHEPVGPVAFAKSLAPAIARFQAIQGGELYLVTAEGKLLAGTRPEPTLVLQAVRDSG
ncbi:hypothetical protein GWK36_12370 [Caldichromatium japonicum]|uniref:Uncharacterized protein n=1 Tax=Caldichromatium japonicum TaxID=2699430 RepID=A0A6G7VF86_9GAMM|nr:hypothetical protein GWK36_12370 [Caldichromatium japonicum]